MRSYYTQINEYLQRLIKNVLIHDRKQLGIKDKRFSIMEIYILKILGKDGSKKMFELIGELSIDRNIFVTVINRLQHEGLVTKTQSLEDKRTYLLNLTEKGHEIYNKIIEKEKDILSVLLNDFSFNEEKAILKFLVKIDMLNKERDKKTR